MIVANAVSPIYIEGGLVAGDIVDKVREKSDGVLRGIRK